MRLAARQTQTNQEALSKLCEKKRKKNFGALLEKNSNF